VAFASGPGLEPGRESSIIGPPAGVMLESHRTSAAPLLAFFLLTFAVTWACFLGAVLASRDVPPGTPLGAGLNALILLGTFAPAMVALALTARAQGRAGVRALLGRLFRWQVPARWYVFALGYMAAIKLTAALVHRLVVGEWPRFGELPFYLMIAAAVVSTAIGGQTGEEIGWRGYALPRLASRLGLGGASVVLGVIWAVWHLPLFYLPQADTYGQSFVVYLLQVIALSVAITWLYWRTRGSLLLVMLLHAAINNTKGIVPSTPMPPGSPFTLNASPIAWLGVGLLWVMAAFLLVQMRGARLSETTPSR
jgi:membrane protease YdiL (CAAX protease family)